MDAIKLGKQVISMEIDELQQMLARLDESFTAAIELIQSGQGRLVLVGMGKSGIIGNKIAATMASTGTPAFSVHPGEAFHGDLGMIQPDDIALMISNSGETEELIRLLPFMEYQGNKVISLTGKPNSTLAEYSDVVLDVSVSREACNNNLAPTSSTTTALVMGDALAVALSTLNNFQATDFARFHPGGKLGRTLLTHVKDVMHKKDLPVCQRDTSFKDIVTCITQGLQGLALVTEDGSVCGIITDGDLRRSFEQFSDPLSVKAKDIMTSQPITISQDERLVVAEEMMQKYKKRVLVVTDNAKKVVGVLQIFDANVESFSAIPSL